MRGRAHFPYLRLTGVFSGLVLLAHLAFAADIPGRESTAGLGEPVETLRFQLFQGYLIVARGSIGGVNNLNIFVDTGATPVLLDTRVARKLNLGGEESVHIVRLGSRTRAEETNLPSLEIGPLKRSNLKVVTPGSHRRRRRSGCAGAKTVRY
jgi:Aspartyl protease